MKPFKIQNRTSTPRRIKFVKNGGLIQFTKDSISSFVENSREAGFCLTEITPLPTIDEASKSIALTAHPMGTDGRVSLFADNVLAESIRYTNLARLGDRQTWFDQNFGDTIRYSGRETALFESLVIGKRYRLVFEDDDLDYEFGEFGLDTSSTNPTLTVEQYRLAFDLWNDKISVDCTGALNRSGVIEVVGDGPINLKLADGSSIDVETIEELIEQLRSNGFLVDEILDPPKPDVVLTDSEGNVVSKFTGTVASMVTLYPEYNLENSDDVGILTQRLDSIVKIEFNDSVTAIEDNFGGYFNNLQDVIVNINGTIGDYFLPSSNISTTLYIGSNVTSIGAAAFAGSNIGSITLSEGLISIGDDAFAGVRGATNLVIPDSVTLLGDGAFSGWGSGVDLTIGSGIEELRGDEFQGWNQSSGSTNLTLKEGLKRIGTTQDYAFQGWLGMSLAIPNSVEYIGKYCFQGWPNATSLTIGKDPVVIDDHAFQLWGADATVDLGGTVSIGQDGFLGWENTTAELIIPGTVKTIGSDAFLNWYKCKGLTIEEGVTDLRYLEDAVTYNKSVQTFTNWYAATKLHLPDSMTNCNLGFINWFKGESLHLGNGIAKIGNPGWSGAEFVNFGNEVQTGIDIVIPNSVTEINAFTGSGKYNNFTLGTGVNTIHGLCYHVLNFYVLSTTPPTLLDYPSMPSGTPEITVFVPNIDTYVANDDWASAYNVQTSETRFTLFEQLPAT